MKNGQPGPENSSGTLPRPFLGVNFIQCGAYGRLYRNREGTAYEGRCPKCGTHLKIAIGEGGIPTRFFLFSCGSGQMR